MRCLAFRRPQPYPLATAEAFLWERKPGTRLLREVLRTDHGIDVGAWRLDEAFGISADGTTIVGDGKNPDGAQEAWAVRLPTPVDCQPAHLVPDDVPARGAPHPEQPDRASLPAVPSAMRPTSQAVRSCPERILEGDYSVTDAASLRQLAGVTWVKGGLTIRGPFVDLRGLECLARVDGMLDIRGNEFLATLNGLDGLTEIHSSLVIGQNPALVSLTGLDHLTHAVAIQLIANNRLSSLAGLDSLVACTVYVIVQDHPTLGSLEGLGNLRHPGDSLYFLNNGALSNCLIADLVDRLRRGQWSGATRVEGNLEVGSCSPPGSGPR